MTSSADDRIHARYRQVLAWRTEGVSCSEIGRRLGVSGQRVHTLERQAQCWQDQENAVPFMPSARDSVTAQTPVQALPLGIQAKGALLRAGVQTVGDIAALSDAALLRLRRVGQGTVAAVRAYPAAQHHPNPVPQSEEDA